MYLCFGKHFLPLTSKKEQAHQMTSGGLAVTSCCNVRQVPRHVFFSVSRDFICQAARQVQMEGEYQYARAFAAFTKVNGVWPRAEALQLLYDRVLMLCKAFTSKSNQLSPDL